jgi:hypothetical protein
MLFRKLSNELLWRARWYLWLPHAGGVSVRLLTVPTRKLRRSQAWTHRASSRPGSDARSRSWSRHPREDDGEPVVPRTLPQVLGRLLVSRSGHRVDGHGALTAALRALAAMEGLAPEPARATGTVATVRAARHAPSHPTPFRRVASMTSSATSSIPDCNGPPRTRLPPGYTARPRRQSHDRGPHNRTQERWTSSVVVVAWSHAASALDDKHVWRRHRPRAELGRMKMAPDWLAGPKWGAIIGPRAPNGEPTTPGFARPRATPPDSRSSSDLR